MYNYNVSFNYVEQIMKLDIGEVAAQRSFCFLWCGSAEGLNEGRKCLRAWGFRRCEDICWIKTNKKEPGNVKYMEPKSVLQHTKEHCLMGIKGTVRRSTDFDFIHANVDLDIIITEEVAYFLTFFYGNTDDVTCEMSLFTYWTSLQTSSNLFCQRRCAVV